MGYVILVEMGFRVAEAVSSDQSGIIYAQGILGNYKSEYQPLGILPQLLSESWAIRSLGQ